MPTRARNLTRKFVLLRWVDPLRLPSNMTNGVLERSGHVKDVTFLNNSTNEHFTEILIHAFNQLLVADDMSSLFFYKPVGSTNVLNEICSGSEVCGPTLKIHFKNGKKVYMRKKLDVAGNSVPSAEHIGAEDETGGLGDETDEDETAGLGEETAEQTVAESRHVAIPGPSRQSDTSGGKRYQKKNSHSLRNQTDD